MTESTVAKLERLHAGATPGEWLVRKDSRYVWDGKHWLCECAEPEQASLIVAMHAALPRLLGVAETALSLLPFFRGDLRPRLDLDSDKTAQTRFAAFVNEVRALSALNETG